MKGRRNGGREGGGFGGGGEGALKSCMPSQCFIRNVFERNQ